jgi:hypothetical protein
VLLVWITGAAIDPTFKLDTLLLLDGMRGLVRCRVETRRGLEAHVFPDRKGTGSELAGRPSGVTAHMRPHAGYIVTAETRLDLRLEGQLLAGALRPARRDRRRAGGVARRSMHRTPPADFLIP